MQILIDTFKNTGNLHHAYLIESGLEYVSGQKEKLWGFFEKHLKHPTQGNPDFYFEKFDSYGISEARNLIEKSSMKPLVFPKKIFVIETRAMTREAQNALLKVFEEPTPNTHFFIFSSSRNIFLPTLRSRMQIIGRENLAQKANLDIGCPSEFGRGFLKAIPAVRSEIIAEILEEKDKAKATQLIDEIILELRKAKTNKDNNDNKDNKNENNKSEILKELLKMRSFIGDTSSSIKLILEHISAII